MAAIGVPQSLRSLFAAGMLAAVVIASGFAYVVAGQFAGSDAAASVGKAGTSDPRLLTTLLVASVSLISLLPALVANGDRFGLAVLGVSMARLLLGMFGALMLTQVGGLPARPVWLGLAAGMGLILVAESVLAIVVLSAVERLKSAGGVTPAGVESSQTC